MLYKNLNPTLNSDLLDKVGFKFDGYYYVNPLCALRLNSNNGAYSVSFEDPAAPQINQTISTYCELIELMLNTIHFTIDKAATGKNFVSPEEQVKFVAEVIKKYFAFDKNLNFCMMAGPAGMQLLPNNEYTYSVTNGGIKNFKVYYEVIHPNAVDESEALERGEIELEIAAQCISWPFLMKFIPTEIEGFSEGDKIKIVKVRLVADDKEIPFFGMGIPTIHKQPS